MKEKDFSIPCALSGVLEKRVPCPSGCPLRTYTLDLQEYQVTIIPGEGNNLRIQRRDQVTIVPLVPERNTPLAFRSMYEDCVNFPSLVASRLLQ